MVNIISKLALIYKLQKYRKIWVSIISSGWTEKFGSETEEPVKKLKQKERNRYYSRDQCPWRTLKDKIKWDIRGNILIEKTSDTNRMIRNSVNSMRMIRKPCSKWNWEFIRIRKGSNDLNLFLKFCQIKCHYLEYNMGSIPSIQQFLWIPNYYWRGSYVLLSYKLSICDLQA